MAHADVVILALFDGPACVQVLDRVRDSLRPGAVVLNTSTIAPAEAAALARQFGASYVHVPLLGSVPAVANGALEILAGAARRAGLARVRPVLDALGEVRLVGDAATAAALKLVANSSLAGAVLALRDSLRQGNALSLPHAQVLDVLELGQLGALVSRKRPFLDGQPGPAEFTIGALGQGHGTAGGRVAKPAAQRGRAGRQPGRPRGRHRASRHDSGGRR